MNLPHPQPGQKTALGKQQGPWPVVVGGGPVSRSQTSGVGSPEQLQFDQQETRAKGWRPDPCLWLSCEGRSDTLPSCLLA